MKEREEAFHYLTEAEFKFQRNGVGWVFLILNYKTSHCCSDGGGDCLKNQGHYGPLGGQDYGVSGVGKIDQKFGQQMDPFFGPNCLISSTFFTGVLNGK